MKHFSLLNKLRSRNTPHAFPGRALDVPAPLSEPRALFTHTRERAIQAVDEIADAIRDDGRQGDCSQLELYWQLLPYHFNVVATAKFAIEHVQSTLRHPGEGREPSIPDYALSSLFLTECHNYLIGDSRGFERLHLVTGIKLGDTRYTLDHMEKVAMSRQSLGGAAADQHALQKALIGMDGFGSYLHGLFHSHPGTGAGATHPSDIDLSTHKRFENGGYPLIGAIFVKGWVRFFAHHPFTITIYGTGVVKHDTHLYKIETPTRSVPYETLEAEE